MGFWIWQWTKRLLGWLLVVLTVVLTPPVLANLWVVLSTAGKIHHQIEDVPFSPVGVVLGTTPSSPYFRERVFTAAELYRSGRVDHLLLSGDGRDRYYHEPAAMRRALRAMGVPDEAMTEDPRGLRTLDSIYRLQDAYHLSRVTIISQQFHNYRALYLAHARGLDAIAYNAGDVPWRYWLYNRGREWFARIQCLVDVHWSHVEAEYPDALGPIE